MTGIAAPALQAEMNDWVNLGGGNSGIVPNSAHDYGFHMPANKIGPGDYSRTRDPNGPNGPYVNWDYACAADFSHKNNETLRAKHREVLARLMRGELPMVAEFIGKPWADRPVYYWARWNGVQNLSLYTGTGHDHWTHIALFRSMADQRPYLWVPAESTSSKTINDLALEVIRGDWGNGIERKRRLISAGYDYTAIQDEVNRILNPKPEKETKVPQNKPHPVLSYNISKSTEEVRRVQRFFANVFPAYKNTVSYRRGVPITVDGYYGSQTVAWVKEFQRRVGIAQDGIVGPVTVAHMRRFGYSF